MAGESSTEAEQQTIGTEAVVPYGSFHEEGKHNREYEQDEEYRHLLAQDFPAQNHCGNRCNQHDVTEVGILQPPWKALALYPQFPGQLLDRSHDGVHGADISTIDTPQDRRDQNPTDVHDEP